MANPELDKYVVNRRKGVNMNGKIKFDDLSIDEANLIFMALAKQPFEQVAGLRQTSAAGTGSVASAGSAAGTKSAGS